MQGDCYVFDRRAALNHSLQSCRQWCFNCRRALSPAGSSRRTVRSRALSVVCCVWLRALTVLAVHNPGLSETTSPQYEEGVSCEHCFDSLTAEQRGSFRTRQRQFEMQRRNFLTGFGEPQC